MPLPRSLARFNLVVTNRILGPLAAHAPGFGVVRHVGRRSGTAYRTPVNLFRHGEGRVIALMYGRDSQWVRNVLAAGAVEVETRGGVIRLEGPEIVHDPTRAMIPAPARWMVALAGVADFMLLRPVP